MGSSGGDFISELKLGDIGRLLCNDYTLESNSFLLNGL